MRSLRNAALVMLVIFGFLQAEVTGIQIQKRELYAGGRSFGATGQYEVIDGVMNFAVDPSAKENKGIIDIGKAPTNTKGLVEFQADFHLVRPLSGKGNGALMFDVVNRGNIRWHSGIFRTPESAETSASFLLERGFTVFAIGWQHDVPTAETGERLLRVRVPAAGAAGKPIQGLVAVSFTLAEAADTQLLSDRGHVPYSVADPAAQGTQLKIKHLDGREEIVAREKWGFRGNDRIYMEGGFKGGRSYEVVYQSRNPAVTGLGYASVRDGVAAIKQAQFPELGIRTGMISRTLAVGQSQSGRFLRGFVHEGFNSDLNGNRVFDGVLALIAGANRVTINYRFAQPSANPGLFFPFADDSQKDAETRESGGLLSALPAAAKPKMMYINTSNEYWRSSNAALVHTLVDGTADFPLAADTRLYVVAGAQHGPAGWPVKKTDRELAPNPLNYRWITRSVFLALDRWTSGKGNPPASRYPRLDKHELVSSDKLSFPAIAAVTPPPSAQLMARAKLQQNFSAEGPITILPPRLGSTYRTLVPRVDVDGNEVGGIRLPELQAPLGTYTGWNQLFPGARDMTASLGLIGGFIPFARTEEERTRRRDPRPSLASRYASREDFVARISKAASECVREGYVLDEDVASLLREAKRQYDDITRN